jgi:glycerol kinase
MLLDLVTLDWDTELLSLFGVAREILPELKASGEVVAEADFLGATLPIAALAGDQQAALFGQACHKQGEGKATYGTGAFVLVHAGTQPGPAPEGVLLTAACRPAGEPAEYALEGSIFVAGAALQWLKDGLGLIADVADSEDLARTLEHNDGVYFVPALAGLGAPHWAPGARGLVSGLLLGSTPAHFARAALEAIGYQTRDVLEAAAVPLAALRVDGGVTANRFAMEFLADILGVPVEVAAEREATALGAAALAGLATGVFNNRAEVASRWRCGARYEPRLNSEEADRLYAGWHVAVGRARGDR